MVYTDPAPQSRLGDADRKALNAISRGEPDIGIEPADYHAWSTRPEIEYPLQIAHWFYQRRSRIEIHRSIEAAVSHLHAALEQRPPITSIAALAETRRAATALAELALSLLYGPPRRRSPRSDDDDLLLPCPPPGGGGVVNGPRHRGPEGAPPSPAPPKPPTQNTSPIADATNPARTPCSPLGGAGIERHSRSMTEGAPSSPSPTEPPTRNTSPIADAANPARNPHRATHTRHDAPTPRIHAAHTTPSPTPAFPSSPTPLPSSPSALSALSAVNSAALRLAARAGTTDTS